MSVHIDRKTPLLLIGGGGHCAAVIDVIESTGKYQIVGIVEADDYDPSLFQQYPVVGTDKDLADLLVQTPDCIITIGQMGNATLRKALFQRIKQLGGRLAVICSGNAHIAKDAELGEGTVVMHHALVNRGAKVGANCIVNSKALIEHHATVGDDCHLSTACVINGDVRMGNECFIGSGSIVRNGLTLVDNVVVGAASYVNRSISSAGTYIGTPVKPVGDQ